MTEKKPGNSFEFDPNPPEDRISYQELGLIAMMIVMLLVAGYFFSRIYRLYQETGLQGPEITSEWGGLILLLILVQIAAMILTQIALAIIHTVTTWEEPPDFEDERDRLIELQGSHHGGNAHGIAFLIAMFALWRGASPMLTLNILVAGMLLSSAVNFAAQLYYRRRGF